MKHSHEFDSSLVCFYCNEVAEKCVGECQVRKLMETPKERKMPDHHPNDPVAVIVPRYVFDKINELSNRWKMLPSEAIWELVNREKPSTFLYNYHLTTRTDGK